MTKTNVVFALTLIRHGETQCNKQSILQGQQDIPLSEEGLKQAALLGQRLQSQKYTHCFVSDLSRAIQTANQIVSKSKTCKSVPLTKDPRLRERKYGDIEGKPILELRKAAKRQKVSISEYNPPGAETIDQVRERAVLFFQELCQLVVGRKLENLSAPNNGNTKTKHQPPGGVGGSSNFIYRDNRYGQPNMHAATPGMAAATTIHVPSDSKPLQVHVRSIHNTQGCATVHVPSSGKPLQVHVRSNHNTQGNDSGSDLDNQNSSCRKDNVERLDEREISGKLTLADSITITESCDKKLDNQEAVSETLCNRESATAVDSVMPGKSDGKSADKVGDSAIAVPGVSTSSRVERVYVPRNVRKDAVGDDLADWHHRGVNLHRRDRSLSASSEGKTENEPKRVKITSDGEGLDGNRTKFAIEDSDDENLVLENEVYKDITPNVVITPNSNEPVVMKRCDSDPVMDLGDDVLLTADVLVVSHGGLLRELIRHFIYDLDCNIPGGNGFALSVIPNTAVSKFTVSFAQNEERPCLTCLFIHDKEHLHCANYKNTRPVS